MSRLLLVALIPLVTPLLSSGQIFTYNFSDVTTSSGRSSAGATAGDLTFSNFTAAATLSANSNVSDVFAFSGWSTGATSGSDVFSGSLDVTRFFEFTITPLEGFSYSLTNITFSAGRTSTGPRQFAIRSSIDGFSENLSGSASAPVSLLPTDMFQFTDNGSTNLVSGQSLTLGGDVFSDLTTATTFRFYAFNSESTGFFRLDNVSIHASTSAIAVPEPSSYAAACSALALGIAAVLRKRRKRETCPVGLSRSQPNITVPAT